MTDVTRIGPSLNMGYNSTSTAQIASCHSRFIRLQQRGRVKVSSIHEYIVVHMHSLCFLVTAQEVPIVPEQLLEYEARDSANNACDSPNNAAVGLFMD